MKHLTLTKGQVWTTEGPLTFHGVSGKGWATYEGDSRDFVLRAGLDLRFPENGRLVVQALEDLEFDFKTC